MSDITETDLASWSELCERATPGPWGRALDAVPEGKALVAEARPHDSLLGLDVGGLAIFMSAADAELCATARDALPRLLAEVKRLRALRTDLARARVLLREVSPSTGKMHYGELYAAIRAFLASGGDGT